MGMVGLALLLLVREQGGSYAAAGAVSGAYFVATAVGAPIAGRLVDRRGQARILLPRALIFPALLVCVCALALLDAPLALIGGGAAAAGALMPPSARRCALSGRGCSPTASCAPPPTRSRPRCRRSPSSSALCSSRC